MVSSGPPTPRIYFSPSVQETRGTRAWGRGRQGRVCLCASVARVGVCVCDCVRPGVVMREVCRVLDRGHSTNSFCFFSFSNPKLLRVCGAR